MQGSYWSKTGVVPLTIIRDDPGLSQAEADQLIKTRKQVISLESFEMPTLLDHRKIINLTETGSVTKFHVDIEFNRRPNSLKGKYQLRVRGKVRLLRLDFNGPSHSNPDGSEVGETHLHIYKEGEHDQWAYEPPKDYFSDFNDAANTLREFLEYCNVDNVPEIR